MAETTDKYTIEIDTAVASQKIKELTKDQADLIQKMAELDRAGKKDTDEFKELSKAYSTNADSLKTLNSEVDKNKKALDEQADAGRKVGGVFSDSINAYNKAGGGIKGLTAAAKAFIATPLGAAITAITAGLGLFKKALAGSESGQRLLNKATQTISATFDVFLQQVRNTGTLLKDIFTGNWSALKDDLANIGNTFTNTFKTISDSVDMADQLYQLEDKESKLRVRQSEYEKQISEYRRTAADASKSAAEREEANKKVRELTVKSIDEEIALEKERLKLLKEKHSLTDSSKEDIQEERDTQIKINELEAQKNQALQQTDKVQARITNSAEKEANAQEKAADELKKKREELEKQAKALESSLLSETDSRTDIQKLNDELSTRQALIQKWLDEGIIAQAKADELQELAFDAHVKKMTEINTKMNEATAKANEEKRKKEQAEEKAAYEAKWQIANNGMNALQEIVSVGGEKTFAASKALQIGEVAMNTYKGAADAYMSAFRPENPGIGVPGIAQTQGAARMATVIATGLAQIAKISMQKPSKSASVSKSVSGGGGTGTIVDTSYSTTTTSQLTGVQGDLATMNMGRNGINSDSSKQTIAVVVDDVTAKQNSQSRIQKMNVL